MISQVISARARVIVSPIGLVVAFIVAGIHPSFGQATTTPPQAPSSRLFGDVNEPTTPAPAGTVPLPATTTPTPVPDAPSQERALATVREAFRSGYAKNDPAGKRALARELLKTGLAESADATLRYVLLNEARSQATAARDVATALEAIETLTRSFALDVVEMKCSLLFVVADALPRDELTRLADDTFEQAIVSDRYEPAIRTFVKLASLADKQKNRESKSFFAEKAKQLQTLKEGSAAAAQALARLKEDPKDTAAAGKAGRFLCLVQGDWARGLPLLAASRDIPAALATRDLSAPSKVADRMAVADGWWEFAGNQDARVKVVVRRRAAYWYSLALSDTPDGVNKRLAESRINESGETPPAAVTAANKQPNPAARPGGPLKLDPATADANYTFAGADPVKGFPVKDGREYRDGRYCILVKKDDFLRFPKGGNIEDFACEIVARVSPASGDVGLTLWRNGGGRISLRIRGSGQFHATGSSSGAAIKALPGAKLAAHPAIRPAGQSNTLHVLRRGAALEVFVNGAEVFKTDRADQFDLTPATLFFFVGVDKADSTIELERVTLWRTLPPP